MDEKKGKLMETLKELVMEMLPPEQKPAAMLVIEFDNQKDKMFKESILKGAKPTEVAEEYKILCEKYLKNYQKMLHAVEEVKPPTVFAIRPFAEGDKIS